MPPKFIEFAEKTVHAYVRAKVRGDELSIEMISSVTRKPIDSVTIKRKNFEQKQQKPQHVTVQQEDEWTFTPGQL